MPSEMRGNFAFIFHLTKWTLRNQRGNASSHRLSFPSGPAPPSSISAPVAVKSVVDERGQNKSRRKAGSKYSVQEFNALFEDWCEGRITEGDLSNALLWYGQYYLATKFSDFKKYDEHESEDVLSAAHEKTLSAVTEGTYKHQGFLRTYYGKCLRWAALDRLSKLKVESEMMVRFVDTDDSEGEDDYIPIELRKDAVQACEAGVEERWAEYEFLHTLSEEERPLAEMILDGQKFTEMAAQLRCSTKTVSRRAKKLGSELRSEPQPGVVDDLQAASDENFATRFLTPGEAAEYLGGLNSRTVTRWAREGYLPAYPIGEGKRRLWRFRRDDLEKWMLGRGSDPNIGNIRAIADTLVYSHRCSETQRSVA